MFQPVLNTDRLLLRPLRADDADAIFQRWAQNEECTRCLTWRPHQSILDTHEYLKNQAEWRHEGKEFGWALCLRDDERPWGTICARPQGHRVELGYVLAREKWGQGLMTEAARAVLAAVWEAAAVLRVEAHCAEGNSASERVLQKIGMNYEGTFRRYAVFPNLGDQPQDVRFYAVLRE